MPARATPGPTAHVRQRRPHPHPRLSVPSAPTADELTLHVWKLQGGLKQLEVLKGHTGRVNVLAFSPFDDNMITASGA